MESMEEYLNYCNFDKYFEKLSKKLEGKNIIVYGTGSLFQYIKEKYDLTKLNIVGVSDLKYDRMPEVEYDLGYKVIERKKLPDYPHDVLLIGMKEYLNSIYNFSSSLYKDKSVKILPLVQVPFFKMLKKIWFG